VREREEDRGHIRMSHSKCIDDPSGLRPTPETEWFEPHPHPLANLIKVKRQRISKPDLLLPVFDERGRADDETLGLPTLQVSP
jgi:hypothetical protein